MSPFAKTAAAALMAVSASALVMTPITATAGGSIGVKIKPKGKDAQKLRAGLKILSIVNGGDPMSDNSATVIQNGKGHRAKVKQKGKGNNVGVIQLGKNTNADVSQNGDEDALVIMGGF
jgi:Curlin associated repeat